MFGENYRSSPPLIAKRNLDRKKFAENLDFVENSDFIRGSTEAGGGAIF